MKEQHYSIWSEYMDQVPLSPDQREVLREAIESDYNVATQLNNDQTIDGLLKLLSETAQQSDAFRDQCVSKFQDIFAEEQDSLDSANAFEIVTVSSASRDTAVTAEQLIRRKKNRQHGWLDSWHWRRWL